MPGSDFKNFEIKKSPKARHLRITIYPEGRVKLTIPRHISEGVALRFFESKKNWILRKLEKIEKYKNLTHFPKIKPGTKLWRETKQKIEEIVKFWNSHYHFEYTSIKLKNQSTLWGSCSRKKNLNFNYKVSLLPEPLRDYIVVHELCHLKELNHSRRFWDLVEETIPDHQIRRRMLRSNFSLS